MATWSMPQMNIRYVDGSYELGGQLTPIWGLYSTTLSQYGVKILPRFTGSNPSGGMSISCGTTESPIT